MQLKSQSKKRKCSLAPGFGRKGRSRQATGRGGARGRLAAQLRSKISFRCQPLITACILICSLQPNDTAADEWIIAQPATQASERTISVSGTLVAESDSTVLIQSVDQRLWRISRGDIRAHTISQNTPPPLDRERLAAILTAEFPEHAVVSTEHYLICHDVALDQAQQAERLLEQVYTAYFELWNELNVPVIEPKSPLVVLLFRESKPFAQHLEKELGANPAAVVAFYSLTSNQISVRIGATETAWTNNYLVSSNVPLDARTSLATNLVHEATHQLMCNSGLQARMANYPLWVSEGLAAYFEPADPFARNGWRRPGGINFLRVGKLKAMLKQSSRADLSSIIAGDDSFRQSSSAGESYSLAWGLNYFLLKRHREEYLAYLRHVSHTMPLAVEPPDQRLRDFQSFFRADISALSQQLAEYFASL